MNYFKNIDDYKLTLVDENERSGRQYTFYFKTPEIKKEIEKLVSLSKDTLDISQIISDIRSRKDLYSKLDYTILNVDHAVDIVAYSIKNNILTLPLIDRVYPPYGLALPGGFIDEGETRYEAAKRELEEELNVKPLNNDFIETKLYNGRDENNKLYDARGEVTTSGFIFEIDSKTNFLAGDDASNFELLKIDLNQNIEEQLNNYKFAMNRHKEILVESIDMIMDLNLDNNLTRK